jgi:membrane protein
MIAGLHKKISLREKLDAAWDTDLTTLNFLPRLGIKLIRIVHLIARGYRDDQCPLHASALTFNTLMSLVPLLAFSLFIAKGFGAGEKVKESIHAFILQNASPGSMISTNMPGVYSEDAGSGSFSDMVNVFTNVAGPFKPLDDDPALTGPPYDNPSIITNSTALSNAQLTSEINNLMTQIFEFVDNIDFAALGGFGLLFLLWFVIQALGRVEHSFNIVWGVARQRAMLRKFTDYLFVMIVFPIMIILASSMPVADMLTAYLDGEIAAIIRSIVESEFIKRSTVIVFTILTFTFLLTFMPNAHVKFLPGLTGGAVVGILLLIWLGICARFQVGVLRANTIYGSFSIIPIVLVWVHVSWQIIMFGAETAFACQNFSTFRMEARSLKANVESRIILSLAVMKEAAMNMQNGGKIFDRNGFAVANKVPIRLLNEVITELVAVGMLIKTAGDDDQYVMSRTPESIKVKDVLDVIMKAGAGPLTLGFGHLDPRISKVLTDSNQGIEGSLDSMNIDDLMKELPDDN